MWITNVIITGSSEVYRKAPDQSKYQKVITIAYTPATKMFY